MDFDEAVSAHSNWKRELRCILVKGECSLRPTDVSVDHKCALGQWIYGEDAPYGSLPKFTKLKYEHTRFHMLAAEVVRGKRIREHRSTLNWSLVLTASSR